MNTNALAHEHRLRPHVVLFADLLGFRARMLSIRTDQVAAGRLLEEYSAAIDSALAVLNQYEGAFAHRSFGDSFMLAAETVLEESESALGIVLDAFAEVQLALVLKGWFVRGGISIGQFYVDDRLVFGPALIEAYEAEATVARDPRIVLTPSVASEVQVHLGYYGDPYEAPQNGFLLRDTDGQLFINYLYSAIDSADTTQAAEHACTAHKAGVEKMLEANRGIPALWAKYAWVARYHDFFVDTWLPGAHGLRIEPKVFAALPELLVPSPRLRPRKA